MNAQNEKRKKVLGVAYSVARTRLMKQILFKLLNDSNLNICYRCNKKIENIDNLTIDHKIPWLNSENPVKLFFDLDNIAFSHHKCNSGHTTRIYGPNVNFRGKKNPNTKLSDKTVKNIKDLLDKGYTLRYIAEKYKVNHTTIGDIAQNKTWKYV